MRAGPTGGTFTNTIELDLMVSSTSDSEFPEKGVSAFHSEKTRPLAQTGATSIQISTETAVSAPSPFFKK